ncbi:Molecular chaperone (small heat shock protein) [hydrothermal vent metagenome]|uniref:Molecular chaperone (Small heat shock protein) n=1 Tax=hydrothermal vent metagenome TaxID=652676 RepID=A0A1W1B9D8_9ZZZZ
MFTKRFSLLLLPLVATLSLHANDPFNDPFFNDPFGDDIFKEMMQMQQNMDKMFNRMNHRIQQRSSGLVSPLGTYKMAVQNQLSDKGDHYELVTNIPESKENHIDINTQNGVMSITAKVVEEQKNKTGNMVSQSRSVRMYQQSMTLPTDADTGSINTTYKDGKLVISVKKLKNALKPQSYIHINGTAAQAAKIEKSDNVNTEKKEINKENNDTKENNSSKKMNINSDVPSMS